MELDLSTTGIILIAVAAIWDIVWRGTALWRAGRSGQRGWFIALLVVNSIGVLPIIYLITHSSKETGKG